MKKEPSTKDKTTKVIELAGKLQCIVLPARLKWCEDQYKPHLNSAYMLWKEIMAHALRYDSKLKPPDKITSNEFHRQEELSCLFYEEQPIGLIMFDWMDLESQKNLDHTYFQIYPSKIMYKLRMKPEKKFMIMGNVVVHPDWRKSKIGPGVSEILFGFGTKRFLESKANTLLVTTRNDRKTNEIIYRYGGKSLMKNNMQYGIESDIIEIERNSVTTTNIAGIPELLDALWNNKIDANILNKIKEHSNE